MFRPEVRQMVCANETQAAFLSTIDALIDREQFVFNLGVLLSQTREGAVGCYLDENDFVHIQYKNGYERKVNVHLDSYMDIVRDVAKCC